MGLNRTEKAAVVDEIGAKVAAAGVVIVAEYRGLGVAAITNLRKQARSPGCLLYTSDAADERSSEDLGGRRTIKKKKNQKTT